MANHLRQWLVGIGIKTAYIAHPAVRGKMAAVKALMEHYVTIYSKEKSSMVFGRRKLSWTSGFVSTTLSGRIAHVGYKLPAPEARFTLSPQNLYSFMYWGMMQILSQQLVLNRQQFTISFYKKIWVSEDHNSVSHASVSAKLHCYELPDGTVYS